MHASTRWRGALAAALGGTAWLGLAIQFQVTLGLMERSGRGPVAAALELLAYFTILTNLLVAVSMTAQVLAPVSRPGRFFARPSTQGGVLLAIVLVGLGYNVLLRWTWAPQGWARVADELLHTVVPLGAVAFWLACVPKGALRRSQVVGWVLYPLAYLGFVLVRGARTGRYPYWFLDVGLLGYGRAVASAGVLMAVFLLLGLGLVALDGRLARARSPESP